MKKRAIILYWLLMLVPTLVIAGAAFKLLWHERERLDQQARSASQDRARAIAENLQITVLTIQDDLGRELGRIPEDRLLKTLMAWEDNDPLVRNAFMWRRGSGMQYPVPGQWATDGKRRFVERYGALFSGRVPWRTAEAVPEGDGSPGGLLDRRMQRSARAGAVQPLSNLVRDIQQSRIARQAPLSVAQARDEGSVHTASGRETSSEKIGGWIPWFSENSLHILGWVERKSDGIVYGVELELMILLSRLITDFPATAPEGMVYALIDDAGRVLHQAGTEVLTPGKAPELTVPLAPQLPHWQVAVYFTERGSASQSRTAFIVLSGLLLAIFVAAIIIGGAFLTWQAHRNMMEARQKTSFVSNVSHELKTPLTSICMYAELLSEGRIKDPEKRKNYLEIIVEEGRRLTRLVNNVLDFGRLEQGRMKYNVEDLNLAAYLGYFTESIRLRIDKAGMKLETRIPEGYCQVQTDRNALEQALLNIVDNALKYAREGGELVFALDIRHDACELRIMDRGPGVPTDHQERIFEKFHRVDDSLTAPHPGSGLGLTIGRALMRGFGGDLIYESRPGGGSCFVVSLPCRLNSSAVKTEKEGTSA